jgi:hypothetical protein
MAIKEVVRGGLLDLMLKRLFLEDCLVKILLFE